MIKNALIFLSPSVQIANVGSYVSLFICRPNTKKKSEYFTIIFHAALCVLPHKAQCVITVFSRLEAHYIIEAPPPIARGSSQLPETFYGMKIRQFLREIWSFFWLNVTFQDLFTEISLACLIIVRFSIRNHRWKARNLLYLFQLPDHVLHSQGASKRENMVLFQTL